MTCLVVRATGSTKCIYNIIPALHAKQVSKLHLAFSLLLYTVRTSTMVDMLGSPQSPLVDLQHVILININ